MSLNFGVPNSLRGILPRPMHYDAFVGYGFPFEIIIRQTLANHATCAWQYTLEVHPSYICVWEDKHAPGGSIVERLRINHPEDLSRAFKFVQVYYNRYARNVEEFKRGHRAAPIDPYKVIPVILLTKEENLIGKVTEVWNDRMTDFAVNRVIRPFPKDSVSWELEFNSDEDIVRDLIVIGEPRYNFKIDWDQEQLVQDIRKYHPGIPVIQLSSLNKEIPVAMTYPAGHPFSAEFGLNRYTYIHFKLIQEYYLENEKKLKPLALDNKMHRIDFDSEWLWTLNTEKLLSMPISKSFKARRPDLHLTREYAQKYHPFIGGISEYRF